MSLPAQDLLSLCALAAQNEDLIIRVGKMALNMALSPNRAAFNIAKGIAGFVYTGIAGNSQGRSLTPTNSRYGKKKVSAGQFIQNEMNQDQQQRLINRMSNVLGNNKQNSYKDLMAIILNNPNIRNKIVAEIKKFLEGENMSCTRSCNRGCCCDEDDDDDDDDYYEAPSCCSSRSKSCSRY